jgi:hypothetical protein
MDSAKAANKQDSLVAFFVNDLPVPLRKLYPMVSKETFRKFRKDGLKVMKVEGLGICVQPALLKEYLYDRATYE